MTKFTEVQAGLTKDVLSRRRTEQEREHLAEQERERRAVARDVQEAKAARGEYRERCARVLARVPPEQHQMARVLLSHADDNGMDDESIIRACEVSAGSLNRVTDMSSLRENITEQARDWEAVMPKTPQELYRAGEDAARLLMGKAPDTSMPPALSQPTQPSGFHLDERAYAEGAAVARQLLAMAGRKAGE